jgi:LCP family protein required for cell wall assembly
MTDWPDDWFRNAPPGGAKLPGKDSDPAPATSPGTAGAERAAAEPTVQLSHRSAASGSAGPRGAGGSWPAQPSARTAHPLERPTVPGQSGGGGGGYPGGYGAGSGWRRWLRPRRVAAVLAVLLSVAIIGSIATYFYLDSMLVRKNVLVDYSGRPTAGSGTNWLVTGSDSRQGLTRREERRFATGRGIDGMRSDTIMLLHLPANGNRPVLISLPRDSYVPIPGHGYDKINAAYAFGGPRLLAQTVQNVTGLRIDHYMSIGFGGFVRVVNAVGGVRVCLKAPLVDPRAGLHLHKGCQVLSGGEALGFVRTRYTFATADLQRIQNQRIFLRALLRKLTSTGVIANPFSALPAASGVAGSLTVDRGTHLLQLLKVAFALRNPITTTVPIAGGFTTPSGQAALRWNRAAALKLFHEIRDDQPISKSLITGSKQEG